MADAPPRQGQATSGAPPCAVWRDDCPRLRGGDYGTRPPPGGLQDCRRGPPAATGPQPPGPVEPRLPRVGRPRRPRPTPHDRAQARGLSHRAGHGRSAPAHAPEATRPAAPWWGAHETNGHPPAAPAARPCTRRRRRGRRPAPAPPGRHTPRRPGGTRQTPDTGHPGVSSTPACHRRPPRRPERWR